MGVNWSNLKLRKRIGELSSEEVCKKSSGMRCSPILSDGREAEDITEKSKSRLKVE
jgi:hypothetical protein